MQDLAYLDMFAGAGNVFRCVRQHNYPAVAVDITYMRNPTGNNPFDVNTPAGLAPLCSKKHVAGSFLNGDTVQVSINCD